MDGGVRFGVDLALVDALLDDYFSADVWRPIEEPRGRVELVVGERSDVYGADELARARAAAEADPRVRLVMLPEAGHWVHVDAPDAVVASLVHGVA